MIFYKTIISEVKFRLILNLVQCSFQRNVTWGKISRNFFIDGLQTPFTDKPFASWMILNLLIRNNSGGTLIKKSHKTNLKTFAAGVFSGMCDLLSPDIKKGLIIEKNSAQDKFIAQSTLYLGHLPWLAILYFQSVSGILYFDSVDISLFFQA